MTKIKFIRYIAYNKARNKPTSGYFEMKREAEAECKQDEIPVGVAFDEMGRVHHTINIDLDRTKFKGIDIKEVIL